MGAELSTQYRELRTDLIRTALVGLADKVDRDSMTQIESAVRERNSAALAIAFQSAALGGDDFSVFQAGKSAALALREIGEPAWRSLDTVVTPAADLQRNRNITEAVQGLVDARTPASDLAIELLVNLNPSTFDGAQQIKRVGNRIEVRRAGDRDEFYAYGIKGSSFEVSKSYGREPLAKIDVRRELESGRFDEEIAAGRDAMQAIASRLPPAKQAIFNRSGAMSLVLQRRTGTQ